MFKLLCIVSWVLFFSLSEEPNIYHDCLLCYKDKSWFSHFPSFNSAFWHLSRVCIDDLVILKILVQEPAYPICKLKGIQRVTISIYRTAVSVFDYGKFCQHLLTLNVDHSGQMVSAPSCLGDYRWATHTYTHIHCFGES